MDLERLVAGIFSAPRLMLDATGADSFAGSPVSPGRIGSVLYNDVEYNVRLPALESACQTSYHGTSVNKCCASAADAEPRMPG